MYPTVVMLLLESQRSMTYVYEISLPNASRLADPMASEVRYATLGHLSFAAGPVHSTTDNETRSQRLQSQSGQEHGLEEGEAESQRLLALQSQSGHERDMEEAILESQRLLALLSRSGQEHDLEKDEAKSQRLLTFKQRQSGREPDLEEVIHESQSLHA